MVQDFARGRPNLEDVMLDQFHGSEPAVLPGQRVERDEEALVVLSGGLKGPPTGCDRWFDKLLVSPILAAICGHKPAHEVAETRPQDLVFPLFAGPAHADDRAASQQHAAVIPASQVRPRVRI